nr:MAG TPA: hypothetical protein [Caudoviricetes sp.]
MFDLILLAHSRVLLFILLFLEYFDRKCHIMYNRKGQAIIQHFI